MYLEYGVTIDGQLQHISSVPRGVTNLKCPYCDSPLLARKGTILEHHFAHIGTTCRDVKRNLSQITLPAYDRFSLNLPGWVIEKLHKFVGEKSWVRVEAGRQIEDYGLTKYNEWLGRDGGFELTKKAKLVLGELSLNLFIDYQEPLIATQYDKLYQRMMARRNRPEYAAHRTNWQIYVAQVRRILACLLYFLSINGGELHKIGVTTRPIAERVAEIRQDLLPHIGQADVQVVRTWPHRGNVEMYFKYRYAKYQHRMGTLTEYFKFDDVKPVRRDLSRMKAKVLTELEQQILTGTLPEPLEIAPAAS